MKWAYREEAGKIRRVPVTDRLAIRGSTRPVRHWSEHMLKSYYDQECQLGSRFKSGYTKETIKKVHENALQRFDQTGIE